MLELIYAESIIMTKMDNEQYNAKVEKHASITINVLSILFINLSTVCTEFHLPEKMAYSMSSKMYVTHRSEKFRYSTPAF